MSGSLRRGSMTVAVMAAAALLAPFTSPVIATAVPAWRVVDLGAGDNSVANAVNDRGHIAGDREGGTFLWRDGRLIDLGTGPGHAADVNNRDEVVGNRADGSAFLWRRGEITDLTALTGGAIGQVQAINDRGDIVGHGNNAHAFLWRDGVLTDLGSAYQYRSLAHDINNRGQVVGQIDLGPNFEEAPARWWRGAVTRLHEPRGQAVAISDSGAITGIHWGSWGTAGFVWHRGEFTELPVPPPTPTGWTFLQPYGINDRAHVAGASSQGAFLWADGRTTILPDLVGTSTAYDLNDRGMVVGSSSARPDGLNHHAVYWTRN